MNARNMVQVGGGALAVGALAGAAMSIGQGSGGRALVFVGAAVVLAAIVAIAARRSSSAVADNGGRQAPVRLVQIGAVLATMLFAGIPLGLMVALAWTAGERNDLDTTPTIGWSARASIDAELSVDRDRYGRFDGSATILLPTTRHRMLAMHAYVIVAPATGLHQITFSGG